MSKDTVRTRSRIVIEKYRRGELVERREIENVTLSRAASRIAYLVYGHDSAVWGASYAAKALALGDYNKNAIKALVPGDMSITEDQAARRWIVEVRWTDASSDEYIVYYVALQGEGEWSAPGTSIVPVAYHFATLPSPLSKAVDDVIKYKWIVEVPYGVV